MRKLSSHPRAKSHLISRGMEDRRYSLVEEMQQHADETDSNSFDLGTPNSQNMTDTDPPSKPLIRVNKPRLSNGNVMEGIPEDGEDETNMGDDEDFKRWNEYQNSRDMSEGLLNEITGMKSDVRREIEVMGNKMNQLEQNIATMLRLLQDHGLKSPGSGFNTTLDPVTPPRTHSRTASIICRVKAEIPEEVLPEWVEMENFGMAGFAKDDGTVNNDVKAEEEEESLPKKIGGRITNKRQRLAKRKKKKAEKASNNKTESEDEDEERENVAVHDLIDEPPAPKEVNEYVEEEKKDISEPAETISINEDLQDSLQPADEEDPGRLSSSIQREPQKEKSKKKRKKKKGEKTSKRENESNKDEEEGDIAMPLEVNDLSLSQPVQTSETEALNEEPPETDTLREDSPRPGSSGKNTEKSQENDNEQLLAESNERDSSPAEESAVPDEQRPSSRADTPRKNSARSEHGEPEENTISSGRKSTSGRQPPSGGNTPRAQGPERHSDDENQQENKLGPSTVEVDPERNSESEQEEQRPTTPGKTSSGRDSRQGAPGDVALKIEDSDDDDFLVTKKEKPTYVA